MAAMVSRSLGFAVTLNSKASPGPMPSGLRAPTGVSVEPTWTMPGWPFRDSASGPVGASSARASGREQRCAVRVNDVEDRRHCHRFRLAVGKLPRGYVLNPHGGLEAVREH